ncbi:hypothetical protein CMU20_13195 [Elizabethkingia anophelis]|nr:hypothetical protein [Elizabethkingia anophelis]
MKKLKIFSLGVLLSISLSCQKDEYEDVNIKNPQLMNQEKRAMGGLETDKSTYDSFKEIKVNLLNKVASTTVVSQAPSSFFISGQPPVVNQGTEGSCSAFAAGYAALSILEANFKQITEPRSPEFIYNQTKQFDECDGGAYMYKVLNFLVTDGACSIKEMPYTDGTCDSKPNSTQKKQAKSHVIKNWYRLSKSFPLDDAKVLLANNLPVIIGINIDDEFQKNKGEIVASYSKKSNGFHFVCIVGYDDAKNAFKVQNSWGTGWGDQGYFWLHYDKFIDNEMVPERYVAIVK